MMMMIIYDDWADDIYTEEYGFFFVIFPIEIPS